ncbi:galactosylceramide sulfotransferase-like, partial [Branchiostoma lanceolatum]|uniref:galactosylceramide sulfotransferase-like n=1 Tax=Branchiostoma lanceolatum TaxID=7740 RepID=UPI003453CD14
SGEPRAIWETAVSQPPLGGSVSQAATFESPQKNHSVETPRQCAPRKKFFFIKTHKTGSSSVTNLLQRYALYHRLAVMLQLRAQGAPWAGRLHPNLGCTSSQRTESTTLSSTTRDTTKPGWSLCFLRTPPTYMFLTDLEREFTTVMILEYFDESLVLLRRLMCWQIKDILYDKTPKKLQSYSYKDYKPSDKERAN